MEPLGEYLVNRTHITTQEACWPWLLSTGSHGYGQAWDGTTVRTSHSLWWEYMTGEHVRKETGLTIDHICHNRICCNPIHLRLLPNRVNAQDNGFLGRTHCPQGHAYTPENTYHNKPRRPGGRRGRMCRICMNARNKARSR